MRKRGLTQKEETFCLEYFRTGHAQNSAKTAGYSPKYAHVIGSFVLDKPHIQARLAALRKKVEDAAIMDVTERQKRLTEIARASIPDFADKSGIKVEKGMANVGAVSEITTRTKYFKRDGEPVVITNLKLHSPAQAIDLLNKMDKVYGELPIGGNTYVFNFVVRNEQAKELANKILSGERLLPSGGR